MSGQCRLCIVRGDLAACTSTPCYKHEDWYELTLQQTVSDLAKRCEELNFVLGSVLAENAELKEKISKLEILSDRVFHPSRYGGK